jgi:hypothetical protein
MDITRQQPDLGVARWRHWHVLTVAECGFSMLDLYGRKLHGIDLNVLRDFADRINEKDESATLYPSAPISAIPKRFLRELATITQATVMRQFETKVSGFLATNRLTIRARNVLVDLRVSSHAVPSQYIEATENIFRGAARDSPIEQVIIFE